MTYVPLSNHNVVLPLSHSKDFNSRQVQVQACTNYRLAASPFVGT